MVWARYQNEGVQIGKDSMGNKTTNEKLPKCQQKKGLHGSMFG